MLAIVDILSRSTARFDTGLKLRDDDATPSIRTYVLFDQSEPRALVYWRDDVGCLSNTALAVIEEENATLELPNLKASIPLARMTKAFIQKSSQTGR